MERAGLQEIYLALLGICRRGDKPNWSGPGCHQDFMSDEVD